MTQRQLSKELGLSLGRTNYVIHALIDKGWMKLSNFKRSDNKLGYLYLLTPEGMTEKSVLAQNFLNRKLKEYSRLKEEIEILKNEL
jgi:EPS-associated MarR family transcriptional regulator